MREINTNHLRVRVKDGSKELEIVVPMTPRTMIGLDKDGTGTNSLKMVDELIDKIKKL